MRLDREGFRTRTYGPHLHSAWAALAVAPPAPRNIQLFRRASDPGGVPVSPGHRILKRTGLTRQRSRMSPWSRVARRPVRQTVLKRTLGTPFGSFQALPEPKDRGQPGFTVVQRSTDESLALASASRQPPADRRLTCPSGRRDRAAGRPGRTRRSEARLFARDSTGKRI